MDRLNAYLRLPCRAVLLLAIAGNLICMVANTRLAAAHLRELRKTMALSRQIEEMNRRVNLLAARGCAPTTPL